MGYIGSHGVAALHRYKYSGVDHSHVAKYVLQPFWSRCIDFFPLWMHPNKITLTGFLFLVISALLGYLYHLVVLLGVLVWDYLSPSYIMGNYPHLLIIPRTGLAFGFMVGRMILSHLCDEPKGLKTRVHGMEKFWLLLLYPPFALANALTAKLLDGHVAGLYLHFATSVTHEITTALGINCFRITRKEA